MSAIDPDLTATEVDSTLAPIEATPAQPENTKNHQESSSAWRTAVALAQTDIVPTSVRGRPLELFARIKMGEQLGLSPFEAASHLFAVDGHPSMSAQLMRALILRAGGRLDIEAGDESCTIVGSRRDGSSMRVTWTMDDAERAGISKKAPWRQYPRAMLLARATSELARGLFPDVLGGIAYTPEEIGGPVLPDDIS